MIFWAILWFIRSDPIFTTEQTTSIISGDGNIDASLFESKVNYQKITALRFEGNLNLLSNAFKECSLLETVYIGPNINVIEAPFMRACYSLQKIIVDPSNANFVSDDDGAIYYKNENKLLRTPVKLTAYTIKTGTEYLLEQCFQRSNIVSLVIPNTVKEIKPGTFYDSYFKTITFESNSALTELTNNAFSVLFSLTEIVIPANVIKISGYCFQNCFQLSKVTFESGSKLESIYENVFQGTKLSEIVLPEGLQRLERTFAMCNYLATIEIPSSVQVISTETFSGCTVIDSVTIRNGNNAYFIIDNGCLYSANHATLYVVPISQEDLTIPSGTTQICSSILQQLTKLTSFSIDPNNGIFENDGSVIYKKAENRAIAVIGSATSANFRAGTLYIHDNVAYNVKSLQTVTFPDGLLIINAYAFWYTSVTEVVVPSSVQQIYSYAFSYSTIQTFKCNANVNIYSSVFDQCKSLRTVEMKGEFKLINGFIFQECKALENIDISTMRSDIIEYTFSNCVELKSVIISPYVQEIRLKAFYNCNKLSSFTIHESHNSQLTTIHSYVFEQCYSLTSFVAPPVLTTISSYAFKDCSGLTNVVLDNSKVKSITAAAFINCINIKSFIIPETVETLEQSAFYDCINLDSLQCSTNNKIFTAVDNVLYTDQGKTLFFCAPGLAAVDIVQTVSTITSNAFYGCKKLTDVNFLSKSSITKLSKNTFYQCTALVSITIPDSISEIESGAFTECTSLSNIVFAENSQLTTLLPNTFSGCTKISSVTFGEGSLLNTIQDNTFDGYTNLHTVVLPAKLQTIGSAAFRNCAIDKIDLSHTSVTTIEADLFNGCKNLNTVKLGQVSSIKDRSFTNCISLSSFEIDENTLQNIGTSSFEGCSKLNISLPKSVRNIGENAFLNANIEGILEIPSEIVSVGAKAFIGNKIQQVSYCGSTDLSDVTAFDKSVVAAVSVLYTYDSFLGLTPMRIYDKNCVPIPTSSFLFTADGGRAATGGISLLIATVIENDDI